MLAWVKEKNKKKNNNKKNKKKNNNSIIMLLKTQVRFSPFKNISISSNMESVDAEL